MQLGGFFAGYIIRDLVMETALGLDLEVYASRRWQINLQVLVHALLMRL